MLVYFFPLERKFNSGKRKKNENEIKVFFKVSWIYFPFPRQLPGVVSNRVGLTDQQVDPASDHTYHVL